MNVRRIYIGGWFQRTTLHLSEIRDFLVKAKSPLDLDQAKLAGLRDALHLKSTEFIVGALECVQATSAEGIEFRVYEDGLIVLGADAKGSVKDAITNLQQYYETKLSPAFGYIFSLGAPVPKELANIKAIYPYFVVLDKAEKSEVIALIEEFGQEEHFEVKAKTFEIYRGDTLYVINNLEESLAAIEHFINEQVFLREFKVQLHRYLNLHRIIWERIAEVKEKGAIKGSDIGGFTGKVESYAKTINLIQARINQMGTYIRTREAVAKGEATLEPLRNVLQFKYETLADTLAYIKELWGMTSKYVDSALSLFGDLQAKSTETSVRNLTIVTSMGVGATLIGLFTTDSVPSITWFGLGYFLALAAIGYAVNKTMAKLAARRSYAISDIEIDKDIK